MNYLVPIDFSDATPEVLKALEKLASEKDDKICLLHVAEDHPALAAFESGPDILRDELADEFRQEHQKIQKHSKALREKGYDVTALLVQGRAVKTILTMAKKYQADMLIMGSHGHSAAYQILVGSISEGVLHKSTCPVLFIPPAIRVK